MARPDGQSNALFKMCLFGVGGLVGWWPLSNLGIWGIHQIFESSPQQSADPPTNSILG